MQVKSTDKPTLDRDWFFKKLDDGGKSVRGLARHMDLDPSAVSRMLSGQRKMKMEEANEIARFLGAPVSEVLVHAGVSVDLDGLPTRVLFAATINEDGTVESMPSPKPMPQSVIDRLQAAITIHGNGKVLAAQIRALKGPLAILDDAVVLFRHTDAVEPTAIGALSICRSRDGKQFIAKIERARKTGEARVLTVTSERELSLITATPVLALIP
jgi:plasmid maintenance system antidote protein VapI